MSSSGGGPSCSSEDTQIYSVKANCIAFMKFNSVAGVGADRLVVGISTVCQIHMTLIIIPEDKPSNVLDGLPPTHLSGCLECKQICPGMSRFVTNFQIRDHDSCSSEDRRRNRNRVRQRLMNSLQKAKSYNKAWLCNRLS